MIGGYHVISSVYKDRDALSERIRAGEGFGWHEHDHELFLGTEQFFRPGYQTHLVAEWIPALEGADEKLRGGARVADMGCGHGASTIVMADAYPESSFTGLDYHDASIERARSLAGDRSNVSFDVASAKGLPDERWDVVCFFDCLHDMGDPVGALARVREVLDPRRHGDAGRAVRDRPARGQTQPGVAGLLRRLHGHLHAALARPGGGAGAGRPGRRDRLRAVAEEAGFTRFRRATETPFNLVLEARP